MATGSAGYNAQVILTGASTAMTTEAMSLSSGKTYYTTDAAKNLWDPEATFLVYDDAVLVAASEYTLDPLLGKVTFDAGYTINGSITVTGNYLVKHTLAQCKGWSLSITADELDVTALGEGARDRILGLLDVSGTLERLDFSTDIYDGGTEAVANLLTARELHVFELNPDTAGDHVFRVFGLAPELSASADVSGLSESSITFMGAVWEAGTAAISIGDPTA